MYLARIWQGGYTPKFARDVHRQLLITCTKMYILTSIIQASIPITKPGQTDFWGTLKSTFPVGQHLTLELGSNNVSSLSLARNFLMYCVQSHCAHTHQHTYTHSTIRKNTPHHLYSYLYSYADENSCRCQGIETFV